MKKMILPAITMFSVLAILSGCSSHSVTIAPALPEKYEVLGKAETTKTES